MSEVGKLKISLIGAGLRGSVTMTRRTVEELGEEIIARREFSAGPSIEVSKSVLGLLPKRVWSVRD